ncbi:acyl-CoA ligase (AMP-forming), exosortase A system-associated [Rhizobiaceae bacterium n13]|uniref:Acyl-CoA ligase (AMP-forming), exosortase A system-associated n=1 Tax=Ferirhizobium litorale TaxID=2927786 RepID=A0AAE3QCV1_9HYPH|nr:acyl-CoA ligase (AMP-forming), exosortase A system-associated [Fererhizobium litorale]MDI7860736.1 acyl-CoA ligase (AMP-forming), exosortase A system-associated [Fererhizobium litorale]MDI7920884.1 acyl-CoA ligase (AMP-forming), exosortase A system-associated [Fererhizobium litorale]
MEPAIKTNLAHLLQNASRGHADLPAVTYKNTTCSYSELWQQACGFAAALDTIGLRRNDRVAVFLEKRIETVVAIFGTTAASCVMVPVNPLLRPQQVAYILGDCDVRVLVTSSDRLAQLQEYIVENETLRHVILVSDSPDGGKRISGGVETHAWTELIPSENVPQPEIRTVDCDMAAILYTSGSTGKPKGVVLSHRNMIVGAESVSHYLANSPSDTILSALPLSFDAGLSQLTTAFNSGAHVILMNFLLAGDVIRLCEKHQVTGITGVPPFWIQVADLNWPPEVAARLRYFANTGGRMPKATLDRLRNLFPRALPYLMYGLTEAFRSTYLDPSQIDHRPDSIGKAIPNAEILVLRPDGTRCDPGEHGELVHRGPLVAMGYWNDPTRTAERFRSLPGASASWHAPEVAVFSGDTVVADEEGFLYFVGRKDEMIKTSGYRISPTEIEEVAYATGLVRDAVALGVEDRVLGQRIVLVASPMADSLDATALLAAFRRRLPQYMVPSEVIEMNAIPTNPNGKFDRVLLREQVTS